jgi:hypothetical protein
MIKRDVKTYQSTLDYRAMNHKTSNDIEQRQTFEFFDTNIREEQF